MTDIGDLLGKKKTKGRRPVFEAPQPASPLDSVVYGETPDVEADTKAEMSALMGAFKGRRKLEDKRFRDATDSEFWVAMCFKTRDDKELFLRALNLAQLGDKYIDGHKAAQILGVALSDGGSSSV